MSGLSKAQCRAAMLARLSEFHPDDAAHASLRVCERIVGLASWQRARQVLAFAPRDDELDLRPLWSLAPEKHFLAPRMTSHDPPAMAAALAKTVPPPADSLDAPGWHRIRYDIWEPLGEPVDLEEVDMVLVPGLAFTRDGHRLGRGKGFYDRFLAGLRPECVKCGIGYDFQLIEAIPTDPHDVCLDLVIVPNGIYGRTNSQSTT